MQHKLNCIASLHTPISPVSHGHRARYYRTAVFAWPLRGWDPAAPRVHRQHIDAMRVQKLALREGYVLAGRAIPRRVPNPTVSQKIPPTPDYPRLLFSCSAITRQTPGLFPEATFVTRRAIPRPITLAARFCRRLLSPACRADRSFLNYALFARIRSAASGSRRGGDSEER